MASKTADKETYHPPKLLVNKDDLLPLARIDVTKYKWSEEEADMRDDYHGFTKKLYFINKLAFIKEVFRNTYSRMCVFAPTGCMKSSMSVALEKFFSFDTSDEEKNGLHDLFVKAVDENNYNSHAHKYTVFRCSFETLELDVDSSLETITNHIYDEFRNVFESLMLEISVQEKEDLQAKCRNYDFLYTLAWFLKEKRGRNVVMIFDEVDFPLTWLISQTNDQTIINRMWNYFSKVLNKITTKTSVIPFSVGFGIHPIRNVLSQKTWKFFKTTDPEKAHFFMFTAVDVTNIIDAYHRNGKLTNKSATDLLTEIKKCYGGYAFNMFCPASVVQYVENEGTPYQFKALRRTFDIITMKNQRIRGFLFNFFFEENPDGLVAEISTTKDLRNVNDRKVALTHYVFAGLLQPLLRELPNSKFEEFSDEKHRLSMANLENKNMIGFFLEDILHLSSSSAAKKSEALMTALIKLDFQAFEEMVNKFFNGLEQIELARERDYHNPLHAYLYALLDEKSWAASSEYSKRTGNTVTGQSGRIDVRLKNKDVGRLYIFELKHLGKENKTVEDLTKEAFSQVRTRGYITEEDLTKFKEIVVVAVICVKKNIYVFPESDIGNVVYRKENG